MSFDDKRNLLVTLFAGKDVLGRKLGIYVTKDDKKRPWLYEIRGLFKNDIGRLPINLRKLNVLTHKPSSFIILPAFYHQGI